MTSFKVVPKGQEGTWNVDGELVRSRGLKIKVCRGMIDIFARGMEV